MDPREVPFRTREFLRRARDVRGASARRVLHPTAAPRARLPGWPVQDELLDGIVSTDALEARVRDVLSGKMTILGVRRPPGTRTDWWLAPEDGTTWPAQGFGKVLDLLQGHQGREIKHPWVLARLVHLQDLALGARMLESEAARQGVLEDLEAFCLDNPPFQGIHWYASIESAHRIASILVVLGLLGPHTVPHHLRGVLWSSLHAHALFIRRYPSLYSSANNHLMAEIAAIYALAVLAPDLPGAAELERWAANLIAREASLQLLEDGVGVEQAPAYQAFVMEWLLFARQAGLATGRTLDPVVDQRLLASQRFLAALQDGSGHSPDIGDDDDGSVLSSLPGAQHLTLSMAGVTAHLLGHPQWAPRPWRPDVRSSLLGLTPEVQAHAEATSAHFPRGGYTVIVRDPIHLVMDHGPLGYLGLAAHGHADALSLWLSLDGERVLVDVGTWRYNGVDEWRAWIRSTRAHNTLTVDRADQSQATGRFTWGRKARTTLHQVDLAAGLVRASHDGYAPLGVTHEREVELVDEGLVVRDRVQGGGTHHLGFHWHLAPGVRAELVPGGADLRLASGARVELRRAGPELDWSVEEQTDQPGPGWIAPSWNIRLAAPCLVVQGQLPLPARFTWTWRVVK